VVTPIDKIVGHHPREIGSLELVLACRGRELLTPPACARVGSEQMFNFHGRTELQETSSQTPAHSITDQSGSQAARPVLGEACKGSSGEGRSDPGTQNSRAGLQVGMAPPGSRRCDAGERTAARCNVNAAAVT
jgi:hypothetical protein